MDRYIVYIALAAANGVMARVSGELSSQIIYTVISFAWLAVAGLALGNCFKR